jgi:ABC-2 type transport system ATP-binding protein
LPSSSSRASSSTSARSRGGNALPSIELDHLTKWYLPRTPVLKDVTFLEEGAGAIGFLGPNGAGKTTTLKLLVGLLAPSTGRALVNGMDPMDDRRLALADVGAIIEDPEPYPAESIFDALERVGELRGLTVGEIDREIDRLHAELHLPPLEWRCGWLSKGERQRVVLAAACLGDPEVLLLDEPTNGMDPAERVAVRNFLRRMREDHLILMSSHLITDIAEICDRLIFINDGTILRRARTEDVLRGVEVRAIDVEFARPTSLEEVAPLTPLLRRLVPLGDRKYRLRFDGSDAVRALLLEGCQRIGAVASFGSSAPVLETAYREIIADSTAEAAAVG